MPNCEFRQTTNTEISVPQTKNKQIAVVHKNSPSLNCEPQFWVRQHDATYTVLEY